MAYLRLWLWAVGVLLFTDVTARAATLDKIWERGSVTCGVDEQNFGFAYLDEEGQWKGFEVDFCRALASAIFSDPSKATFIPLNSQTRFSALQKGDVDVLLRSTTWTFARDTVIGFDFPAVTFYDQLGILAHKSIGVTDIDQVEKGTLCVATGTTTLDTVNEYIATTGKAIKAKVFNSREGLNNFFFSGQCDLYAADQSALMAVVSANAPKPEDFIFLKTTLSKEPLGPVVREDDREWHDIVQWLVYGLIEAEERGINKKNLESHLNSHSSSVRFMLGQKPGVGSPLRLSDKWLYDAISAVGNYGEIFERNLGKDSTLMMKRGLNALWRDGGMIYAMPIR